MNGFAEAGHHALFNSLLSVVEEVAGFFAMPLVQKAWERAIQWKDEKFLGFPFMILTVSTIFIATYFHCRSVIALD